MSSLSLPPIHGGIYDKGPVVARSWSKWFTDLYTAISGVNGAGAQYLTIALSDITSTESVYLTIPRNCVIVEIDSCLNAALSTSETITISNSSTGTLGTISLVSSAAGTVNKLIPTTNNIVNAGSSLKITSAGVANSSIPAVFTITVQSLA